MQNGVGVQFPPPSEREGAGASRAGARGGDREACGVAATKGRILGPSFLPRATRPQQKPSNAKVKPNERSRDGIFLALSVCPLPESRRPSRDASGARAVRFIGRAVLWAVPAAWSSRILVHTRWTQLLLLGLRCSLALRAHPRLPKHFSKVPK
ncbi:hypothetical protein NN561_000812 [Cricetulus griseus]